MERGRRLLRRRHRPCCCQAVLSAVVATALCWAPPAARREPARRWRRSECEGVSRYYCALESTLEAAPGSGAQGEFKMVQEGRARLYFPRQGGVFYNPGQSINRDFSVLACHIFHKLLCEEASSRNRSQADSKPKLRILDALSASGLRVLRYWKELGRGVIETVVANDIDPNATKAISRNLMMNGLRNVTEITVKNEDANFLMFQSKYLLRREKKLFNVIDLDPYGSAAELLQSAIAAVDDGGMLMITCTDKAVLAGKYPDTCLARYGSVSSNAIYHSEMALRIVLYALMSIAGRLKSTITPLLSLSIDFYVRVFVRVHRSAEGAKLQTENAGIVAECKNCCSHIILPLVNRDSTGKSNRNRRGRLPALPESCTLCGLNETRAIAGPIYTGALHDRKFITSLLESLNCSSESIPPSPNSSSSVSDLNIEDAQGPQIQNRKWMFGLLSVIRDELLDIPLYYSHSKLCRVFKVMQMPKMEMIKEVLRLQGCRVSGSHTCSGSLKTNASANLIARVYGDWARRFKNGTSGHIESDAGIEFPSLVQSSNRPPAYYAGTPGRSPKARATRSIRS